jgi:ParB family chromosome partitioning protein
MPREYAAQFPGELIPVRVLDFDADIEPDLALQVEVAENEKRRDYTPAEVRKLAEKLKLAGYADTKGRPAKGEKALRPALEVIIGKSQRTVRRYLNEYREGESGSTVRLLSDADAIGGLKTQLSKWHKAYGEWDNELIQSIDRDVVKLLKRLAAAQKKSRLQERQAHASEVSLPVDTTAEAIGDEEIAN